MVWVRASLNAFELVDLRKAWYDPTNHLIITIGDIFGRFWGCCC